jgi:hypothetical protein
MLERLIHFVLEREGIRKAKEAGLPKPWTTDPVLQHYRFCNVYREDDKVTKWIRNNWLIHEGSPNIVGATLLGRMINWPDTLAEIGFPHEWDKFKYAAAIRARANRGDKVWTGAYMITAESNGKPKEVSVCNTVDEAMQDTWDIDTCYQTWLDLQTLPRIGSFMAAQVVADLKMTHLLENAEDRLTFCAPGPGSQAGLNVLLDIPNKTWKQQEFQEAVNQLRAKMPIPLDAQNMQNVLCEFNKYVRGYSRSTYPGEK